MNEAPAQAQPSAPDAGAICPSDWPRRELTHLAGQRAPGFQVVFRRSVLQAIQAHGQSTTSVEVGGVLVGDVYHDDAGPYLLVHAAVPADCTQADAAHVTFTGDTWAGIHREMDQRFPDARIVGWYHTHPDFGIFLSEMDLFIQRNFFDLPWQVAFVYDPVRDEEGLFVWRGGEAVRVPMLIEEDSGGAETGLLCPQLSDPNPGDLSPPAAPATCADERATPASFWPMFIVFVALLAAAITLVEWLDRTGQIGNQ